MQPIAINLSKSRNARVFEKSNLVHYEELRKATRWIQERIDSMENGEEKTEERIHDTICILGGRGSGKTSFIKCLLHKYKDNKEVAITNIIDPTLIEEKGYIFPTIISQISKMVETKLLNSSDDLKSQFYLLRKECKHLVNPVLFVPF